MPHRIPIIKRCPLTLFSFLSNTSAIIPRPKRRNREKYGLSFVLKTYKQAIKYLLLFSSLFLKFSSFQKPWIMGFMSGPHTSFPKSENDKQHVLWPGESEKLFELNRVRERHRCSPRSWIFETQESEHMSCLCILQELCIYCCDVFPRNKTAQQRTPCVQVFYPVPIISKHTRYLGWR